ncbi:hypothetical protein NE237_007213 [Protea cynaroides]|uniref:non-specific serine/threonine protein kinase n=1 Tax=Protea cynaroides TaxID=273540 RepID=A0A9Q0QWA5_9MAGN|nr:hypothetical protein NE237_007213 [Protea cynaroides]
MGSAPSLSSRASFVLAFPFFILLVSRFSLGSAGESLSQSCSPFRSNCGNSNFRKSNISYPFSKDTKRECGLGIIRCVNNSTPRLIINSEDDDPDRFQVIDINYTARVIAIQDLKFSNLIRQNRCNELYNFTTPPNSGNLSFQLKSHNNTYLRICPKGDPADAKQNHDQDVLWGHRACGTYDLDLFFHTINPGKPPSPSPSPSPPLRGDSQPCMIVEYPLSYREDISGEADDVLHWLSGGFHLQWNLPQQCHECDENGTFCLSEHSKGNQGHFICVAPNHGISKKTKVITGIAVGVGGILITCFVFFLIYYRRCCLPKNRSPSYSLTPLSARIASYPRYGIHLFTYEQLEEATDNFNSNQELGDGGFGTVYYGKLRDGREVAVKRLYENNCKRVKQFMNEVGILARLCHPNLVTLYGCTSRHSRELLLVYEFIPNGTVADHLHGDRIESGSLPWPTRMSIAIETAQALTYLHASDIIHRDVKTNNILLDENFHVKVADFGLSRLFPTEVTHVSTAPQGTPGYVDPQYHQCYRLTEKSDVYSFGVVLIELISTKPAVDMTRHWHEINLANMAINKIQNQAVHELVDPLLGYESDDSVRGMITSVAALAFRCLQYDIELRPSMEEVLEVLRGIGSEDHKNIFYGGYGAEAVDIPMDHTPPPPLPITPDSFTGKWVSCQLATPLKYSQVPLLHN